MTKEMQEKYRKLCTDLRVNGMLNEDNDSVRLKRYDEISHEAEKLANDDFEEQIIELWKYDLTLSPDYREERERINEYNRLKFVLYYGHKFEINSDKFKFINDHWHQVDNIILILRNYIDSLNKMEHEEERKRKIEEEKRKKEKKENE